MFTIEYRNLLRGHVLRLAEADPRVVAGAIVGSLALSDFLGRRELWSRFWNRNMSLKWLLAALLVLPILRLIAAGLTQILSETSYPFLVEGSVVEVLFLPVLMGLFSGIHEEFGWRGYALPRFQAKWNALTSSIILGSSQLYGISLASLRRANLFSDGISGNGFRGIC